jgi:glycosyltransferase involved in cell wall biosynthesis
MSFEYEAAVTRSVAPIRAMGRIMHWARRLVRTVVPGSGALADALRRFRRSAAAALPTTSAADASYLLDVDPFEVPARARPLVALAIGSLAPGGAERQLVALATSQRTRAAVDPVVVVLDELVGAHAHYAPAVADAGVPIVVAGTSADPAVLALFREDRALAGRLRDLPAPIRGRAVQMAGEFLRLRPDCVHAWLDHQNIWSGVAALAVGVPHVVLSTRNVNPSHFPYLDQPWFRDWYRLLLRSPRVNVINNSRPGAADYAAWLGCAPDRIRVVLNGLDPSWISRPERGAVDALRAELARSVAAPAARPLLVGGVFRLSEEKQPLLWLDVVKRIARERDDVVFFHAGQGPLEGAFRAEGAALIGQGRLHVLGRRSDVPALLSAADVLLHAARFEGTPNVLLEAAHLGCPVVATAAGGSVDAVDHGRTGFLLETSDGDGLHRAVASLLADHALRETLGAAAPAWIAARFGLERMVDETLDCYPMLGGRAR